MTYSAKEPTTCSPASELTRTPPNSLNILILHTYSIIVSVELSGIDACHCQKTVKNKQKKQIKKPKTCNRETFQREHAEPQVPGSDSEPPVAALNYNNTF